MAKRIPITSAGWSFLTALLKAAGYATVTNDRGEVDLLRQLKEEYYYLENPEARPLKQLDKAERDALLENVGLKIHRLDPGHASPAAAETTLKLLSRLDGLNDASIHRRNNALFDEIVDKENGRINFRRFLLQLTAIEARDRRYPYGSDGGLVLKEEAESRREKTKKPLSLKVFVAPSKGAGRLRFKPIKKVSPVRGGEFLSVKAVVLQAAYLYGFWVKPSGEVQPVYPWKPGQWDEINVTDEIPVTSLELPHKKADGTLGLWRFEAYAGLETLVVITRTHKLSQPERIALSGDFKKVTSVRGIEILPGPHRHAFVGSNAGTRINLDAEEIMDAAGSRHREIERRLAVWCEKGACLSFPNAG